MRRFAVGGRSAGRIWVRLPFRLGFVIAWCLLAVVGRALAEEPNSLWGRVISRIELTREAGAVGETPPVPMTVETFTRLTGLAPGHVLTAEAVRKALDTLYAQGTLRDIRIEGFADDGGVRVVVTWIVRTRIESVSFKGNDALSDKALLAAAHIKLGDEYAEDLWKKAAAAMTDLYASRGYFDVRLTTTVSDAGGGKVGVHVAVEEGAPYRVSGIAFSGKTGLSERELKKAVGLGGGDIFEQGKLDRSVKALEALYPKKGYIEARVGAPQTDVDRERKSVSVRIPVQAGPEYRIVFEGNRHASDRSLREVLLVWEERSVDDGVLQDSIRRIQSLYEGKGYPFSKVRSEIRDTEEGRKDIIFRIDEGRKMWVRSIRLSGHHAFTSRTLMGLMETGTRNRLLFRSGILIKSRLDQDVAEIRTLYRKNGYLGAKVEWSRSEDASRPFDVLITIEEGVQTRIGSIEIEGNRAIDRTTLLKASGLAPGKPYAENLGEEARREILIPYSRKGYVSAESTVDEKFQDDRRRVDLTFSISEGEPVKIGPIRIEGNRLTRDWVIRRELLVKPMDPYDYEKILKSQQALYQLGLFRKVRFEPIRPDVREPVKEMSVVVEERPPKRVDFGLGYADVERMRGFIEIGHANLFGTARSLSARAEVSQVSQKYTLSYKEPWILGLRLDGRASAIYAREKLTSFERRTVGGTVGLDKNLTPALKASLSYQYENVKPFNVDPSAVLSPEDSERTFIASLNPSVIWDRRDDPFNPRSGFLQGVAFKDAAQTLGSQAQFLKATGQSSWFYSPYRPIVLALSGRGGWAINFGESKEVPITERFFLGGRSTVRGYSQDSVGINNETIVNGTPTGGNIMMVLNGEIRISLPYQVGLVLFSDSGGVWLKSDDVSPSGMRASVGAGLRYNTPVGPLRLDVGRKIRRHRFDVAGTPPTTVGESVYELHFTLGQAF